MISCDGRITLVEETPQRWRIPRTGTMRVPGIVFASRSLLPEVVGDRALEQVTNVATLPGIVRASYAMPDVHWGYGFPIGGVAATDVDEGGVVSPGGVGFDISCGVRLLVSSTERSALEPRLQALMDALDREIPRGLGAGAVWHLDRDELREVLLGGACYAVDRGHGVRADLAHCEDGGAIPGADPDEVGERALARGAGQVGSLGAGNHFLEVQVVDTVFDEALAAAFGLRRGCVCVMIHSGSRGLGHQICSDHVRSMQPAMREFGISVPDLQLACAPVRSPQGQSYLGAMAAAANFGRANRQLLTEATRRAFATVGCEAELSLLYDVSHNLAKLEHHDIDGQDRLLCVHRKGAHARPAARAPRPATCPFCDRPARAGAGFDGHGVVRARRRRPGGRVPLHVSRRGPDDEPPHGPPEGERSEPRRGPRGGGCVGALALSPRPRRGSSLCLQGRRRGRRHVRTGRARPSGRPHAPARRREGPNSPLYSDLRPSADDAGAPTLTAEVTRDRSPRRRSPRVGHRTNRARRAITARTATFGRCAAGSTTAKVAWRYWGHRRGRDARGGRGRRRDP